MACCVRRSRRALHGLTSWKDETCCMDTRSDDLNSFSGGISSITKAMLLHPSSLGKNSANCLDAESHSGSPRELHAIAHHAELSCVPKVMLPHPSSFSNTPQISLTLDRVQETSVFLLLCSASSTSSDSTSAIFYFLPRNFSASLTRAASLTA
jgi:hypothetical protein